MADGEFLAALAFGAFTILVFARQQFDRPSYAATGDVARVVEVLSPRELRRGRVYFGAYVVYASALLLIYISFCVYATVPMLALLNFDANITGLATLPSEIGAKSLPIGYAEPVPPQRVGRNPALPLAISAAMIGLAPSIPFLQKAEDNLRMVAHRLSGIPTRLVDGARTLIIGQRWIPADRMKELGASRSDIERHDRYAGYAGDRDGGAAFLSDLDKIFAFRAWFLDERIGAPPDLPEKVVNLAALIESRIRKLFLALDELIGASAGVQGAGGDVLASRWDEARRDADRIGFDICLLLMLYDEHGLPTAGAFIDGSNDEARADVRRAVRARVDIILSDVGAQLERIGLGLAVWSRATVICVLVAFLWGLALTTDPVIDSSRPRFVVGLLTALSSLIWYAPALFVALALRDAADRQQDWRNPWDTNWSSWLLAYVFLFVGASLATTVFVVAYSVYWAIEATSIEAVWKNIPRVLGFALKDVPGALVGPILAVALVAVIDAKRAGAYDWIPKGGLSLSLFASRNGNGSGFWHGLYCHYRVMAMPFFTAALMFLWRSVSKGAATQISEEARGLEPRSLYDIFIADSVVLMEGLLSFFIGFFCVYFVQNLVIHGLDRRSLRPEVRSEARSKLPVLR